MRISDWSSDVCSSDLFGGGRRVGALLGTVVPMLADAVEIAPRLTKQPAGPVFIGAKFVLDAFQRGILLGLARVELIGHRARSDQRDRRIDRTHRGGEAIVLEHEIIEDRKSTRLNSSH